MTSKYLGMQQEQHVWTYRCRMTNEGSEAATLMGRHWRIVDQRGHVIEVPKGSPGVVGHTPRILGLDDSNSEPAFFEYASGTTLATAAGTMEGSFQMVRDGGARFDAVISPFMLHSPGAHK